MGAAVHALESAMAGLGSLFMGRIAMTAGCAVWLGLSDALRSAMANNYGDSKTHNDSPEFCDELGHCTSLTSSR